jgi:hypothetical protein
MWHILATICFRTWSLTLKEKDRLRVFENGVLRRTSEPNSRDVKACWRKLHTGGFHDLHSSPNTIRVIKTRKMRWAGHVAYMREKNSYKVLVGKPKNMRLL